MNALVVWLALAAQTPVPLPPVEDLARFPTTGDCIGQLLLWREHLAWLSRREGVADWPQRELYRRWQQQTKDVIGLWETLQETHFSARQCWDDDTRRSLAALRRWLGPKAYYAGRLPQIPEPPAQIPPAEPNNAAGS